MSLDANTALQPTVNDEGEREKETNQKAEKKKEKETKTASRVESS